MVFLALVDGSPHVLMQLRSNYSHEGGTWSCPGGALDAGETAFDGALREAAEEIGSPPAPARLVGQYVLAPAIDWTYTTVVVEVPRPFGRPLNFETEAVEWVPASDVGDRPLHPGFAGAWAHIATIVDTVVAAADDDPITER